MALTPKPLLYSVNTGAALCPDHLYMFDEGAGATLTDKGKVGGKNLTITGADWATDGTHGPILDFISANLDNVAITETAPVLGVTSGLTAAVILRVAAEPVAAQPIVGLSNSAVLNVFYAGQVGTFGNGRQQFQVRNTTSVVSSIVGNDIADDLWHLVVWTFAANSQTGSMNGAGYGTSASAAAISAAINKFSLGAKLNTSSEYADVKIAGCGVWVNTILSQTDQSDLFNGGNVWTAMGVNPAAVVSRLSGRLGKRLKGRLG